VLDFEGLMRIIRGVCKTYQGAVALLLLSPCGMERCCFSEPMLCPVLGGDAWGWLVLNVHAEAGSIKAGC